MPLFNQAKKTPWDKFFKVTDDGIDEMITLRVVPDRTVDNKSNYKLMRALHELYQAPLARVGLERWLVRYTPASYVWYDVLITKDEIKFYFTVPIRWETYARQKITGCWPRANVDRADQSELAIPLTDTKVTELVYKRHNIFALHVDRAEDTQPLGAVMSACRDMADGDLARLSICASPNNRLNWQDQAEQAHKQFGLGKTPQRRNFSKRKALLSIGTILEGIFQQVGSLLLSILGHNEDVPQSKLHQKDQDKREILIEGKLKTSTLAKRNEPTFNTRVRVVSHSTDVTRREITSRALSGSFIDVAGDNELEKVDVSPRATVRILCEINRHRLKFGSLTELDVNIMSAGELGKLAQLPSAGLQDDYAGQLDTIKRRQDGPPSTVSHNGIALGHVELKKELVPIYKPISNYEELCLPDVLIGGMGCGKTKGFAANTAVEAVKHGFGAITIDPAKRELGREIMATLPPEMYYHIDLSKVNLSLDWRESFHTEHMTTRLANTILAFFNMDGSEYQTERYLFAAVMGMRTCKLGEILKIFENDKYRAEIILAMSESINKTTLMEFTSYAPDRRRAILAPIYNRMSILLRDPYLAECLAADDGLDFWELMQEPKITIIDIPDDTFDPLTKDLLVNLISTKIDIAMRLRPEEKQFPYFVIMDEPHQYLRSAKLWTAAAVESRKFRVKYCWLFHSWEQIPSQLAGIILDAGPHFHIYRSSEKTYKSLRHFLEPYTVEDVTKMPLYHAINIIRANLETTRPFMAKMLLPPSKQGVLNVAK